MTYKSYDSMLLLSITTGIIFKLTRNLKLAEYEKSFIDSLVQEIDDMSFEEQEKMRKFSLMCELEFVKRNQEQKVH